MSRIGKLPVALPQGVTATLSEYVLTVKGPKGTLTKEMSKLVNIAIENNAIVVTRPNDEKAQRSHHGLTRALINNMVVGVTTGFVKNLELVGVGYKASKQGTKLVLNVGYSHPVEFEAPEGLEFDVPAPTQISVKGMSKEAVGQMAAVIRDVRRPEPYKGKGIRYAGEVVRRKEGKTGKK
jgi:large subunit ribosomal protein L6